MRNILAGLSSRSKNKSPVLAKHGSALTSSVSADTLPCRVYADGSSAVGVAVSSTIKASMFGPAFAGATNLDALCIRSSHLAVPANLIASVADTLCPVLDTTVSQSPVALIPSRSCLATRASSPSYDTTTNPRENTP